MMKTPIVATAALALVLSTARASAVPEFPPAMAAFVGTKIEPACTVCHATNAGGNGTVTRPFGIYLRSRGLSGKDDASLTKALQAMRGEGHDTDGDGKKDFDALAAGEDPNGKFDSSVAPIAYGCGGRIATHDPSNGVTWLLGIALAALVLRRPRRAR